MVIEFFRCQNTALANLDKMASQSHYLPKTIGGDYANVSSQFAINPCRKAIVFIHGYSGNATGTWSQFDSLLPLESKSHGHDLYFYGYDGFSADMVGAAGIFRQFLHSVLVDPYCLFRAIPNTATRTPDFSYDEITIVAHSLGAVVARWALLDLYQMNYKGLDRFRMILFAPAHKGARVGRLAAAFASGFPLLGMICTAYSYLSPLVGQLDKASPFLANLENRTKQAIQAVGKQPYLVPHRIYIAQYEKIVENIPFASDLPAVTIPKKNHVGICKPTEDWRLPLNEVLNAI